MTCLAVILLVAAFRVDAAEIRLHLPEFKVTGASNRDELRTSLQALLVSRLEGGDIRIVGASEPADATLLGTYIVFGKVFSLDGRLMNNSGRVIGRAFEQGESLDDVIPAVGRLAQKLGKEISAIKPGDIEPLKTVSIQEPSVIKPAAIMPVPAATPDSLVTSVPVAAKPQGDIIRAERSQKAQESGMIGQRLEGVMVSVALGKRLDKDERELVVALDKELRLYKQGKGLQLLETEKDFREEDKIISIDVADIDNDGVSELYVTCFHGEDLSSRVYLLENGKFRIIASDLPYYFRAYAFAGGVKKVYAQQLGREEDFYGGLYEVMKKGNLFETVNPARLPRFANIFNTNMIRTSDGASLFVVLHPDGQLMVYDDKGENLWRGSDKFGGSETYFSRDDSQNIRVTGNKYRKRFIEQRLTVTKSGEIIVPKNEGNFLVGDSRSFNKSAVYAFAWNGAALDELWHTKPSQGYLADYSYDVDSKELVVLEIVKKEGVTEKGATAVVVKKVE